MYIYISESVFCVDFFFATIKTCALFRKLLNIVDKCFIVLN